MVHRLVRDNCGHSGPHRKAFERATEVSMTAQTHHQTQVHRHLLPPRPHLLPHRLLPPHLPLKRAKATPKLLDKANATNVKGTPDPLKVAKTLQLQTPNAINKT